MVAPVLSLTTSVGAVPSVIGEPFFRYTPIEKLPASTACTDPNNPTTTIATNTLTLIVEKGNPLNITSLSDLASPQIRTVLCDVTQPCGKYSARILERANIVVEPRSRETSVSGVTQKVSSGEADAGIVYVTDALNNASKLDVVSIDKNINISNNYPIAALTELSTVEQKAAQTFIDFVLGNGQIILNDYGFVSP